METLIWFLDLPLVKSLIIAELFSIFHGHLDNWGAQNCPYNNFI